MKVEFAPIFYKEILKIADAEQAASPPMETVGVLGDILARIFITATSDEKLTFSTLFARISYAGHRFQINQKTLSAVHFFRRQSQRIKNKEIIAKEKDLQLGLRVCAESVLLLSGVAFPTELATKMPTEETFVPTENEIYNYKARARVVVIEDDPANFCLVAIDEENPEKPQRVRYGIPDRNESFTLTIKTLRAVFGFPVTLNLIDVEIDKHGEYRPRAFVVEPDFLMDISAIAETFQSGGTQPYSYLVKKFLPYEQTPSLILGNVANYFLDRLLTEPDVEWATLIKEIFRQFPFAFAPMSDAEVRDLVQKAQRHFLTLKSMAKGAFAAQNIEPEFCVLEPSFFSEKYGLQGRLDLFYKKGEQAAIVELKSGKPYMPNAYGISRSHFTQTLLYDLLVRSVFGAGLDPAKYILYSGEEIKPLRFGPTVTAEQMEALQMRNNLIAIEKLLGKIGIGDEVVPAFGRLRASPAVKESSFTVRDFNAFETVYTQLNNAEKKYFNSFSGFIAREHFLAKSGAEGFENAAGHAALWRANFEEKQQTYSILSNLQIVDNQAHTNKTSIVFRKTALTNPLANFRVGDIAVLYPAADTTQTVLDHQIVKCTITELTRETVTVSVRFRQFNLNPFDVEEEMYWNLEPDMFDGSFLNLYRGLFEWASAPKEKRNLLLTLAPPKQVEKEGIHPSSFNTHHLTSEQELLFQKIISSKDYFLLWGPPGTGKTSVMLRALAEYWLTQTDENILLLAYTNRAVDEICEALESISADICEKYVRIGSQFATSPAYRKQLLSEKTAKSETRADLKAVLESQRIFVGTVSSFAQNGELLRLKKFGRLVIDEASQLIEPQLIGLLTHFPHFVLIGDHRQLPAITVQSQETTKVENVPEFAELGLLDLRDSYFERLYRRCVSQNWHWAFGRLSHQGRMHADLMEFPNKYFYDGFLKTLPNLENEKSDPQNADLIYKKIPDAAPFLPFQNLAKQRKCFFHVKNENAPSGQKNSAEEASMIAQLVHFFRELYAENGLEWKANTLGVITPWRAQIAQIRKNMTEIGLNPDEFTIDTVERYQGGAREIILISCCVHNPAQMSQMISLSTEGVDRKMNVALTRARKHLVLVGNEEVLKLDERYRNWVAEVAANDYETSKVS